MAVRLICLQDNLSTALSIVEKAVATRSTLPVLSNVYLEAREGRLMLSATNLDISITCWIGANIEEEGATTVPARLFSDFVDSLPSEPVELELIVRTQTLNIRCGRFEANIRGMDATEFPEVMTASKLEGQSTRIVTPLRPATLRKIIQQVTFAAASEETHPFLSGAFTSLEGDQFTLAATDGYRLSVRNVILPQPVEGSFEVIIPAKALDELARIATEADESQPIEILIPQGRNQILFHLKGQPEGPVMAIELLSQLIESTYPDFRALIPKEYNTRVVVKKDAFLKALKIAHLFAKDRDNMVKLEVAPASELLPGSLTIRATSRQYGDNVSQVEAKVQGAPLEIAFNVKYLIEALSVMEEDEIALEATTSSSPGVLKPADGEDFIHVVMPMYLEEE
jgi:DNA polymerase-3 subunit beta